MRPHIIVLIAISTGLIIFGYQNCAKNGSNGAPGAAGPMGLSVSSVSADYVNGTAQFIANNVLTTVNFDTQVFDSNNAVTTGASWAFTAPTTGLYNFNVSVRFGSGLCGGGGTSDQLTLLANGGTVVADLDLTPGSSFAFTLHGSTNIRLTANEFVSAQIIQNSGGTCEINTGIATSISIARIGD